MDLFVIGVLTFVTFQNFMWLDIIREVDIAGQLMLFLPLFAFVTWFLMTRQLKLRGEGK